MDNILESHNPIKLNVLVPLNHIRRGLWRLWRSHIGMSLTEAMLGKCLTYL